MGKKNFLKSSLTIAAAATVMSTLAPMSTVKAATTPQPTLTYSAHVAKYAWMGAVTATGDTNTPFAGTVQESKLADAFKINLEGIEGVELEYSVHNRTIGWSDWMKEGEVAGYVQPDDKFSSGNILDWKQAEAIKIRVSKGLDKLKAAGYEIRYRVHLGYDGWEKEWTVADDSKEGLIRQRTENSQTGKDANGNKVIAGSVGWSRRIEALQVMLVKTEKEPEKQENITVELPTKYINNVNNGKMEKAKIKIANQLDEPITAVKAQMLGEDGKPVQPAVELTNLNITVPAHANQLDDVTIDLSTLVTSSKIPANKESTFQLVDNKNNTIATFTVENRKNAKVDAKVTTNRTGSEKAEVSVEGYGDAKVAKMHYKILKRSSTNTQETLPSSSTGKNGSKKVANILDDKLSVSLINNKVTDASLDASKLTDKKFETGAAYDLYYVLEDEYGNIQQKDTEIKSAVITLDGELSESDDVIESVTAPDLTKTTSITDATNGVFTIKLKDKSFVNQNYILTLYKGSDVVYSATKKLTSDKVAINTLKDVDNSTILMSKPGEYVLEVAVAGTEAKKSSESVKSEKVTVTQLSEVSDVAFTMDTSNTRKITWNSSYGKDDITNFKVAIYKIDAETGEKASDATDLLTSVNSTATGDERELVIDSRVSLVSGTSYKAYVTTVAKDNQIAEINSEEAESKGFFTLGATAVSVDKTKTTSNSISLKVTPVNVTNKTTKYNVEYYRVDDAAKVDPSKQAYTDKKVIENAELKKENNNYYITIEGLESGVKYGFRVIAIVDNVEGMSAFNTAANSGTEETTKKAMPSVSGMAVSKTAGVGKICHESAGIININNVKYENIATDYPAELAKIDAIIQNLQEGDIIKDYSPEKITIDFESRANANVALGTVTDMTIELIGDDFSRKITATGAKEIILSGTNGAEALFDVSSLASTNAKQVTLKNTAKVVTGGKSVVLSAGNTAIVDDITVKASAETKMATSNTNTLTIDATNGNNDLEITTEKGLNLVFKGEAGYGSTQTGNVKITATSGTLKVSSITMNVESNIKIDATDVDSITVNGAELSGAKEIEVKTTAKDVAEETVTTITTKSKIAAPITIAPATAVELRTYTDAELKAGIGTTNSIKIEDAQEMETFRTYLAQFGVLDVKGDDGKYITISGTTKDQNAVTIKIPSGVSKQAITNLQ